MSFVATMFESVAAAGDKALLIEVRGKELVPTSAAETRELTARVRGFMAAAGVQPGDRVALLAPNSARWVAVDLAILGEGAIGVPLYSRQEPRELAGMLRDCAPVLLVVSDETLEGSIRAAWPDACRIARFEEVFAAEPTEAAPFAAPEDHPVTIIYTSGTSGEPKGVVYHRRNVDYMLPTTASRIHELTGQRGTDDKVFHFLPFCFAGSRIMLWTQLYRGNPILLSTDLTQLVQEIPTADPHYYLNVPAVLERIRTGVGKKLQEMGGVGLTLYTNGWDAWQRVRAGQGGLSDKVMLGLAKRFVFTKIKDTVGRSLEFLICGSAPLSPETQSWFEMIGIPVFQVYGLTETTAIVTMDRPGGVVAGRVGHAIPGCEAKITDEGELICRGPNIFAGYWKKPEATADAIRDGWFHTGDQAELDDKGNWKIVGRLKNLIKPESGHWVAPEQLEQRLIDTGVGIEQAMVVGHARPFLAALVAGSVEQGAIDRAVELVNKDLPHYRRIRKAVKTPEAFTIENGLLTANQKMRRKVIEQRFQAEIEGLYR